MMQHSLRALQERRRAERAETAQKLRSAIATIDAELSANGGIYPQNDGKLSRVEVCRRAGLDASTLRKPHNEELQDEVEAWLKGLAKRGAVTSKTEAARLRKKASVAAQDHKGEVIGHLTSELAKAVAVISQLEAKVRHLEEQLRAVKTTPNVVSIRRGDKP